MPYTGNSATDAARPVQIEAAYGLTGAVSPSNYGILAWKNGIDSNEIHLAVLPQPQSFVIDNIVQAGDVRVALTFPSDDSHLVRPSLSRIGSDLLLSIGRVTSSGVCSITLYVANNADNPTSWSVRGVIQTLSGANAGVGIQDRRLLATGTIFVMDSGRWVYQSGLWTHFQQIAFHHSGVWTSDNNGATWTQRLGVGYYLTGGSYLQYHSNQIGYDPVSGLLFWVGYSDQGGSQIWISSNGADWTATPPSLLFLGFGDSGGTYLMRINAFGEIRQLDTISPLVSTLVGDWRAGKAESAGNMMSSRAIVTEYGFVYFFFNDDTVSQADGMGWLVGQVGIG